MSSLLSTDPTDPHKAINLGNVTPILATGRAAIGRRPMTHERGLTMAIDQSDLDAAKQTIERSVTQFNTNLATIYTFDGKRIYPPGKHENELARLSAGVESSVDKALALADRAVAEVEAARLAPHADI